MSGVADADLSLAASCSNSCSERATSFVKSSSYIKCPTLVTNLENLLNRPRDSKCTLEKSVLGKSVSRFCTQPDTRTIPFLWDAMQYARELQSATEPPQLREKRLVGEVKEEFLRFAA